MFVQKRALIGDVLVYRKRQNDIIGGLIAFFSDLGRNPSEVVHVGIYAGSGMIIHSHIQVDLKLYVEGNKKSGCHMARIESKDHDIIDIYRVPYILNIESQNRLIVWMRSKYLITYDLESFSETWYRSVFARLLNWTGLSEQEPDNSSNPHNKFNCAEYVASAYEEALNIKIIPNRHKYNYTPADFVSSESILRKVS